MNTFGSRLKSARKAKGMNQAELAAYCRNRGGDPATHSTVSQYEAGQTTPTIDNAIAMADALDVSLDWLFGRSGSPTGPRISDDAIRVANEFDRLPKAAQETVMHSLKWAKSVGTKRRPATASEIIQAVLSDKTIPR